VTTTCIGTTFSEEPYGSEEKYIQHNIVKQINDKFPYANNLLINTTWFGPQFSQHNANWEKVMEFKDKRIKFHNVFFLATVDPPMIGDNAIRDIKESTNALSVYFLGNFDTPHQFNFFAYVAGKKFINYTNEDTQLNEINNIFVNYNRKPKPHRVDFVELLIANDLLQYGTVTLGKDDSGCHSHSKGKETTYLTINEKHEDYTEYGNDPSIWGFGIPQDYFTLHRMDIWNSTFLYINAATEFNPRDELFCQQDVFKPLIGMRPFVINGVQRTYHWLRKHGFKTFNHYWSHIDIENGDVHDTLIELINYLKDMKESELMSMYNDMLPDLLHNKERFYVFANEQRHKMEHLF
jgi:hypothetical protein